MSGEATAEIPITDTDAQAQAEAGPHLAVVRDTNPPIESVGTPGTVIPAPEGNSQPSSELSSTPNGSENPESGSATSKSVLENKQPWKYKVSPTPNLEGSGLKRGDVESLDHPDAEHEVQRGPIGSETPQEQKAEIKSDSATTETTTAAMTSGTTPAEAPTAQITPAPETTAAPTTTPAPEVAPNIPAAQAKKPGFVARILAHIPFLKKRQ